MSVREGAKVHRPASDGKFISSSCVKTAKNKVPVSGVYNDSEGLYVTTVCRCLVRRPHYSARLSFSGHVVRASSPLKCLDRDCTWEGTVQGLGMAMSTIASEKNRKLLFIGYMFYKQ